MLYEIQIGSRTRKLEVSAGSVTLDGQPLAADIVLVDAHTISLIVAGRSHTFHWEQLEKSPAATLLWLGAAGCDFAAEVRDPRRLLAQRRLEHSGRARLKAPMAGKVVRLLVALGDQVESGQPLLVLEAMKMQNEVRTPKSGTVVALPIPAGATVATNELLAEVE